MKNKNTAFLLLAAAFFCASNGLISAEPSESPFGADAVSDLYSPAIAGAGGFVTTTGGAPASALNPAQGGDARRMVFDAGYLAIPVFPYGEEESGYMQAIEIGAMFPSRYGVFGGSLRYIGGFGDGIGDGLQFLYFPIKPTLGGNISAAKEVYPGMSVGAGLNFGSGGDWTFSGDLGFYYNTGKNLGPFRNFTWAVALRGLGVNYFPTWLTPAGGISFELFRTEGKEGKADPLAVGFSGDLSIPSAFYFPYTSMIIKTGLNMTIAEIFNVSVSWPGGSGFNVRELVKDGDYAAFPAIPSVGIGFNIILPSGGERIAGGRLPSDGDLKVNGAFKPLYEGVTAIGGGVTWHVGVADKKPPVVSIDYDEPMYFSPNYDGRADYLEFPLLIVDDNYVTGWQVEIKDEQGNLVRHIENKEQRFESFNFRDFFNRIFAVKKQVDVPPVFIWDGINESGSLAPDGNYYFTISATDDSGNVGTLRAHETVLKNTPPEIEIAEMTGSQLIFNPMGGDKDSIAFILKGTEEDAWEGGIWNTSQQKIRTFDNIKGKPEQQIWDGRDNSGEIAADGVYSYRISATDRAENTASAMMNNIILDGRVAGIFLTSSASHIAPKANQEASLVDFSIRLSFTDRIESWKLELKDSGGAARKTFSGEAHIPETQGWTGLDDSGAIREGVYTPELTVRYTRGDEIKTTATAVSVDVSGPVLSLTYTPEYFSPDNDGVEDELFISLSAQDASPIANWKLEIRDPESGAAFYQAEGARNPTPRLVWNGRSNTVNKNELAQSATDYPYTFTAADILGNVSFIDGKIGIDVLVIRDGDKLRILIPSIVFRPNEADFEGLSKETVDNNTRIIRRIAQTLNKFRDYKVQVEGHANPTTPPGSSRDREQPILQRISENRARKIVDELVRFGVARTRLSYIGVGGSRTVVPWDDMDNRWKNRRVEFILIK